MIQPNPHSVIVKIKSQFTNKKGNLSFDPTFRPLHNVVIYGEVVGVPKLYQGQCLNQKYYGHPSPKGYTPNKPFNVNIFKPKSYTVSDSNVDVRVGDRLYFHYLSVQFFQEDRKSKSYIMKDDDGYEYHRISVDSLFCTVRDGEINMLLGNVLVKPVMVKDEKTRSGLIKSVGSKPKHLVGVVEHIGDGLGDQKLRSVENGDTVLYLPKSEFENEIEGVKYFVMKQWHIVARKENDEKNFTPVGSFIRISNLEEKQKMILGGKDNFIMNGKVDFMGELCGQGFNPGNKVVFETRSTFYVDYKIEKSIFVRYEDVYGRLAS